MHAIVMAVDQSAQTVALSQDQWTFIVVGIEVAVFLIGALVGERL
jgi:hypothetical protein